MLTKNLLKSNDVMIALNPIKKYEVLFVEVVKQCENIATPPSTDPNCVAIYYHPGDFQHGVIADNYDGYGNEICALVALKGIQKNNVLTVPYRAAILSGTPIAEEIGHLTMVCQHEVKKVLLNDLDVDEEEEDNDEDS